MAGQDRTQRPVKFVYRHSSLLLKCVVLATILLCVAALLTLRGALLEAKEENQQLHSQAAQLEAENEQLRDIIAQVGSQEAIEQIAREELDLVDPNAEFFTPGE